MNKLNIKNMDVADYTLPLIKNLDSNLPKPPFRMAVTGSSGSGKTNFICNFFRDEFYGKNIWKPNHIFVFSPTCNLDPKFRAHIPSENFYDHFDESVFNEIYSEQKGILETYGKKRLDHVLIILDDLLGDRSLVNKGIVDKIIHKTRHYNVSMIFSVQKYTGLPRTVRLNSDFMAIFFCGYNEIDDICCQNFDKRNREQFRQKLMELFSEPHNFLCINSQAKKLEGRYKKNLTEPIEINLV